jgi:hypothetical protein
MSRILSLSPVAKLSSLFSEGQLVAFDVAPEGDVYFVIALRPLDLRFVNPGGASFAKTIPERPQNYRVFALSGNKPFLDIVIENERFNIHYVQPLVDELLLVCARSHYRGPDDFDRNGRIYTKGGKFDREILLGDGIHSVQATSLGTIWTSYFDEGVFGNFGWTIPVGASGLVAWDAAGKKLYEFEPSAGLDPICDCYAVNVASDEDVWCCYYTEFPLVHLNRRRIQSVWKGLIEGSDAFAISGSHVLFRGGYDDRDVYQLFSLAANGNARLAASIELHDHDDGTKLIAERVVGRADAIHIICRDRLYCVDIQAAISA